MFQGDFRRSRRFRGQTGVFLYRPIRAGEIPRYAVVVGKKTSASAVKRNRLKRQMYEALRKNIVPENKSHHVICLYKNPSGQHNNKDFLQDLKQLLSFWRRKHS